MDRWMDEWTDRPILYWDVDEAQQSDGWVVWQPDFLPEILLGENIPFGGLMGALWVTAGGLGFLRCG